MKLFRDEIADALLEQAMRPSPFASNRPRTPLTLRQKARLWRSTAWWWIHDRLFGDCRGDDW